MWASLSFEPVLRFRLGTPFVFNILSRVFQLVHFAMWRSYYVTWFDSFDMCFVLLISENIASSDFLFSFHSVSYLLFR